MHNRTSTFIAIEKNAEVPVLFSITFTKQKKRDCTQNAVSDFRLSCGNLFLYTLSA